MTRREKSKMVFFFSSIMKNIVDDVLFVLLEKDVLSNLFALLLLDQHQALDVYLKSGSHLPKKLFYLFQRKSFKNDEKCLFHLKNSFHSQNI